MTVDRTARRESPGGEPQIVQYKPFDRVAAITLVDTVRRACPGMSAADGLRACRTLADLRNHPDKADAIARALDVPTDGSMQAFTPAPDAWSATRHEQRADDTVKRYGMARVQGDTIGASRDTPSGFSGGLLTQMLEDLPRNTIGPAVIDVGRLTTLFYGAALPRLIGTDVAQKHQVIYPAATVDPASCRVAVNRQIGTVDRHTASVTPWPWRGEHDSHTGDTSVLGKVYLRASESRGPGMLAAAATDDQHIWVGHHLMSRGPVAARKSRAVKTPARTIGERVADTVPDLFNSVSTLNRDERVVLIFHGVRVTVTRGKSDAGTFSLTTPAGTASGLRTPQNVAKHIAQLVA